MAVYNLLSDDELLHLLKEGDRKAFSEIYNRYKGLLYIHAFNKLRDEDEAADIVHDLFAALWDRHKTLEITGHFSGYLYTSIRNRIFKLIAKKSNAQSYITAITKSIHDGHCITDHRVRQNMLTEIIEKEIASLPSKMRIVFELSRKSNFTHKKIADHLDISEETVKSHISHALKQLRVKLGILLYVYLSLQYLGSQYKTPVKSTSPENYFTNKFPPSR